MSRNIAYITRNSGEGLLTFSQTHYDQMDGNVFLYHGRKNPIQLKEHGVLNKKSITLKNKIRRILRIPSDYSIEEEQIIYSFKQHKIEVVYVDFGMDAIKFLKVCKALNLPLIVAFLGFDISVHDVIKQYAKEYKDIFDYAYKILIVSKHMKPRLLDLGCPEDKIVWSPYPPEEFFFKAKPNFTKNNFFMMGRFVDKKAPYYAVLALKKVVKKHPDSILSIAGDGPLFSVCQDLVKYFNLDKNIHFIGRISQEEAFNFYENSLAFIQHSIIAPNGDMEGTPVSILEASAAGIPIVSTIHAGIVDVVIDKKTGFLVKEHDVDAMAEAMCYLIENKEIAMEFGQNGRDFVKNNFHVNIHMKLVNELLLNAAT